MNKTCYVFFLLFIIACNQQAPAKKNTSRAFYYWKSVFKLSAAEKARVDSLHVSTLYVKFFDVKWNQLTHEPEPVAKIQITDTGWLHRINVIPVVFISNDCLLNIDAAMVIPLAENTYKLINEMSAINDIHNIREIQLDCDWTVTTREKYFALLTRIKQLAASQLVSATIRLHQIKFFAKSGVPPVAKGLLMCYNMGNLKNPATRNSIIESAELKKYTGNLATYTLPMDVAFPLFEWKVLFRKNNYAGLIQNLPTNLLSNAVVEKSGNRYTFLKDTILAGYAFKQHDFLRCEQSNYDDILLSANEINKRLPQTKARVILYHLDSITLNKYSLHEMENIYNSIH